MMADFDINTSLAEIGAESVRKACQVYRTAPLDVVLDLAGELYVAIAPQLTAEQRDELVNLLHSTRHDPDARRLREVLVGRALVAGLNAPGGGETDAEANDAQADEGQVAG